MTLSFSSSAHTYEQNGVAEQKNRHILEIVRALLIFSSVPSSFWAEPVLTSVNLINITLSSVLAGKSPHEHLYSSLLDYRMLHTFGCACNVLIPPTERAKLSARSAKCVLLGISSEHKGYRCYYLLAHRLLISHHVSFVGDSSYFLLHFRMFAFYHHLVHYLLSPLEFQLIQYL